MKRKVSLVLFIIFLLIAAFAGYKFISAELDFRSAVDYYDTLADTWVKTGSPAVGSENITVSPANVQQPSPSETAFTAPREKEIPSDSSVQELPNPEPDPAESRKEESTALPAVPKSDNVNVSETEKTIPAVEMTDQESEISSLPDTYRDEQTVPDQADRFRHTSEQPPIMVDFDGLCGENQEIVGWIYCEDTPINYPVLQASDNKKYLTVQPDGRTSGSGAVFIDCKCEHDFTSDNTIMYGHNLKNKMFSSLSRYSSQSYYNAHPIMWLLTPDGNYKIELFAGFVIKDGGWVYQIDLPTPYDWSDFTDYCLKTSSFKPIFHPEHGDRLITLSTCNYSFDNARYVVVGSLLRSAKE